MNELNQMELQDIRHTCGACTNFVEKLTYYKTLTTDENVIDIYTRLTGILNDAKLDLTNFL